ncbi:MAG: SAM-dependent methyltransferase, partial [Pseudomonadota bacterium]
MDFLLEKVFQRVMARGALKVTSAAGRTFVAGPAQRVADLVPHIRFRSRAAERRLLLDPELAFGELFTDGDLVVESGDIADVLAALMSQPYVQPTFASRLMFLGRLALRRLAQF